MTVAEVLAKGPVIEDIEIDNGDFSGRLLCGLVFRRCRFPRCKFRDCDLSYCEFDACDLYQCDFHGACLYVTRFYTCDLTRAVFAGSLMSGFRLKDVDVTQTKFGLDEVKLGSNRRNVPLAQTQDFLHFPTGAFIGSLEQFEGTVTGFVVSGMRNGIELSPESKEPAAHTARRKEEIYKYLKRAFEDFGYQDLARRCHYLEKRYHRHTLPRGLRRALDYLGEVVWRYGTDWRPAAVTLGLIIVGFTLLYWLAPWAGFSGMLTKGDPPQIVAFSPLATLHDNAKSLFLAFYFSCLISTLVGADSISAAGGTKVLLLAQVFLSVTLLSMVITTLARRFGE